MIESRARKQLATTAARAKVQGVVPKDGKQLTRVKSLMSASDAAQSVKARHQAVAKASVCAPSIPIEQPIEDNAYEREG
ncbi:hypothetical protein [Psychromicrobium sp. YIM B11713]|uniref:hypothetical protein n=1 Tax=Psychromicrobium sp. YIM B11713 TaxID=3145233 RepID=UPI00374E6429